MSHERELAELVKALDQAEAHDVPAPCTADPKRWTADVLSYQSSQTARLVEDLAAECRACPALAECADYAAARLADGHDLYGVVAGRLVIGGAARIGIRPRPAVAVGADA